MQKEKLTLANVRSDLNRVACFNCSRVTDWRANYYIPITLIAVIVGFLLRNVWIGLLIFSVAAYHIVRQIVDNKEYKEQEKKLKASLDRSDVSVTLTRLSHISVETVHEPHQRINGKGLYSVETALGPHQRFQGSRAFREITVFHFETGDSWRMPDRKHYGWSKTYNLSCQGLQNISVPGNEFFFIYLQGHYEAAYIYPCKFFELGDDLKKKVNTP